MLLVFTILMELSHISFVSFTCVHVPDYQCQLWGEIILHAWPLFFARCSHLYIFFSSHELGCWDSELVYLCFIIPRCLSFSWLILATCEEVLRIAPLSVN